MSTSAKRIPCWITDNEFSKACRFVFVFVFDCFGFTDRARCAAWLNASREPPAQSPEWLRLQRHPSQSYITKLYYRLQNFATEFHLLRINHTDRCMISIVLISTFIAVEEPEVPFYLYLPQPVPTGQRRKTFHSPHAFPLLAPSSAP